MGSAETKNIFSLLYPAFDIGTSKKFISKTYSNMYYNESITYEKLLTLNPNQTISIPFIDTSEKHMSEEAIKNKKTSYSIDSVDYTVNNYGLRISNNSPLLKKNLDMMAFGCSFTYGVGIPVEELWSELVFNTFNFNGLNFGYPGSSVTKIIRHIINIVPFYQPKSIIILLPHYCREEIVLKDLNEDKITTYDFIPGYIDSGTPTAKREGEKFTSNLNFDDRKANVIKNLILLKYILEVNNITGYISSWDIETYYMVKEIFPLKNVLPLFEYNISDTSPWNLGRDGEHPGRSPIKTFANKVIGHIEKNYNELKEYV